MGIGTKSTPIAFVNSCEVFTFSENLDPVPETFVQEKQTSEASALSKKASAKIAGNKQAGKREYPPIDTENIDKAFEISANEEGGTFISKVGLALRKIDPSFDPRTYGFKNLTQLFESLGKYEVIKNEVNRLNHPLLKLK